MNRFVVLLVLLLVVVLALVGCGTPASGATTTTAAAAQAGPATTASSAEGDKAELPNLVGLDLQSAQDTLQAAGWSSTTSHDATGQGRMQAVDRNWFVVEQSPAAGSLVAHDTKIDIGVVKEGESGTVGSKAPTTATELPTTTTEEVTTTEAPTTTTTEATTTTLSKAAYKKSCVRVPYKVLSKNPDALIGNRYTFKGQIMQIMEEEGNTFMLVNVTNEGYGLWTDLIAVLYPGTVDVYEDDIINIWGGCSGSFDYDTKIGGSNSVPMILALYVEKATSK